MQREDAYQLGKLDGENVILTLMHSGGFEEGVVIDGSMLSPSWRALEHGETVFQSDEDGTLSEAYAEGLDKVTENVNLPDGAFLIWDEGMLCLEYPAKEED